MLIITPSDQPGPNGEPTPEWAQFKRELEKTKELVNRIPKPDPQRELHPDTSRLGFHGRLEFIKIGNDLLVSRIQLQEILIRTNFKTKAPNYNRLLASHFRNVRDIIQFCRVNQLPVPYFKARDALFIRDEQIGNFRHYFVSSRIPSYRKNISHKLLRSTDLTIWCSPVTFILSMLIVISTTAIVSMNKNWHMKLE